jgi:hypothetical protein
MRIFKSHRPKLYRNCPLSYLQHCQDSQRAPHSPLVLSALPVLFQVRFWNK